MNKNKKNSKNKIFINLKCVNYEYCFNLCWKKPEKLTVEVEFAEPTKKKPDDDKVNEIDTGNSDSPELELTDDDKEQIEDEKPDGDHNSEQEEAEDEFEGDSGGSGQGGLVGLVASLSGVRIF